MAGVAEQAPERMPWRLTMGPEPDAMRIEGPGEVAREDVPDEISLPYLRPAV